MQIFKSNLFHCFLIFKLISCAIAEDSEYDFEEVYNVLLARSISSDVIHEYGPEAIKLMMNLSVDPCEDFYEFACGNFKTVNKFDDSSFDMIGRKMFQAVRDLLLESDEKTIGDSENSYFRDVEDLKSSLSDAELKAKRYFKSCMDTEAKKVLGIKPAVEYFKKIVEKPFSEGYTEEEAKNWVELLVDLKLLGENVLFNFRIGWLCSISQGFVGLNWNFKERNIKARLNQHKENIAFVQRILEMYGVSSQRIPEFAVEIVEFDKLLAEISSIQSDEIEEISMTELFENYNRFEWESYIKALNLTDMDDYTSVTVDKVFLNNLYAIFESEPTPMIYNYLQFRLAKTLLNFTSELNISGQELEEFCFEPIKEFMNPALNGISLRRFLSKSIEEDILAMLDAVDKEFIDLVTNLKHITEDVKEALIAKAENTSFRLGLSNRDDLINKMNNDFQDMSIIEGSFFGNAIQMKKYAVGHDKKFSWSMDDALEVNAFYLPYDSHRVFTLGFMLPTAYHVNFPKWINYGNFASTIGHELIHAFDTDGFLYKAGNEEKQNFTLSTIIHHFKKSLCLARQYSAVGMDGIGTLSENTADLGGLIIAYAAYKKLLNQNEELTKSEQMNGTDLKPDQLFFVSYAQTYCDKGESENVGVHAPNKFRAIGSIINLESFAKAFQCPLNSAMNPAKKCSFL